MATQQCLASFRTLTDLTITYHTLQRLVRNKSAIALPDVALHAAIKYVYEAFEAELIKRRALLCPEAVEAECWILTPLCRDANCPASDRDSVLPTSPDSQIEDHSRT